MDELDRTAAALRGSFFAKHFPANWYALEKRKENQGKTSTQLLKERLQEKFKRNKK